MQTLFPVSLVRVDLDILCEVSPLGCVTATTNEGLRNKYLTPGRPAWIADVTVSQIALNHHLFQILINPTNCTANQEDMAHQYASNILTKPPTPSPRHEHPLVRSILDHQGYTTAAPPMPVARMTTGRHPECTRTAMPGSSYEDDEGDEEEDK